MEKQSKNKIDDDDDLPPELEDLPTELINKKPDNKTKQGNIDYGDYTQVKEERVIEPVKKQEKESFGGFKKGFFSSEPSKPKEKKQIEQPKESDIIKPQQKKDPNVLDEVQEAMKSNQGLLGKSNEWMTPDLLGKISQNPKLFKLFGNPEYMQAIGEMQKNPKGVMERYANNTEFRELLVEFSQIMGGHFEALGKAQQQSQQQNSQPQMDKEVEEILKDKKVKMFLEFLQKSQKVDFNHNRVLAKDPDLAAKIKILIQKGLINIQNY